MPRDILQPANTEHARREIARKRQEAHRIASQAASRDVSDPFTYGRVFTHMMNGVGEEHSYGGER